MIARTSPAPLVVTASLAAVEGGLLLVYAVLEVLSIESGRVTMGITTALFFLLYGAGLLVCAWGLGQHRSWARSPIVLAQLIQLGVAWSFWGGETTVVAIVVGAVALIVLAGIFHPASLQALEDAYEQD